MTKKERPSAKCAQCGDVFNKRRDWQKFCSPRCTRAYHREQQKAMREFYRQHKEGSE